MTTASGLILTAFEVKGAHFWRTGEQVGLTAPEGSNFLCGIYLRKSISVRYNHPKPSKCIPYQEALNDLANIANALIKN